MEFPSPSIRKFIRNIKRCGLNWFNKQERVWNSLIPLERANCNLISKIENIPCPDQFQTYKCNKLWLLNCNVILGSLVFWNCKWSNLWYSTCNVQGEINWCNCGNNLWCLLWSFGWWTRYYSPPNWLLQDLWLCKLWYFDSHLDKIEGSLPKPFLWLRKYSTPLKPGYPQLERNLAPLQLILLHMGGELKLALAIVAFFDVEVTSDMPFKILKKKIWCHFHISLFFFSFLIFCFVGDLVRLWIVWNGSKKKKRIEKKIYFFFSWWLCCLEFWLETCSYFNFLIIKWKSRKETSFPSWHQLLKELLKNVFFFSPKPKFLFILETENQTKVLIFLFQFVL